MEQIGPSEPMAALDRLSLDESCLETARRLVEETDAALQRSKTRNRGENGRVAIGVYASPAAGNMHAPLPQ